MTAILQSSLRMAATMGIKSLSRYIRQYKKAGQRELALAGSLIDLEFELYKKLMAYL